MDTMTMTIRVSAIEDDARYRESLAALFTHAPGFSWGGSFARPSDALEAVAVGIARGEEQPWDLMLMDLDLPGMHGVEVTRQLKQMLPGLQIVVLTVFEDVTSIVNAICAGADGYSSSARRPTSWSTSSRASSPVAHHSLRAWPAPFSMWFVPRRPPREVLAAKRRPSPSARKTCSRVSSTDGRTSRWAMSLA
jgi:CheY-like chemotaxis protein